MAIKASDWEKPEPSVRPRGEAVRVKGPYKPELPEETPKVCYTQSDGADLREVVPLAFYDRWHREQQWYVERWLADMAIAMRLLFTQEHKVNCVSFSGYRQHNGWAGGDHLAVYLEVPPSEPGVSLRPEIMVRVWDLPSDSKAAQKKGRSGGGWPLGLVSFDSEEAAK